MEVIDVNKKVLLGLMATFLLAGAVGCSNSQSSDKKMNDQKQSQQTDGKKMNMTDDQMKNMKNSDKK
jgi:hypothetical protein